MSSAVDHAQVHDVLMDVEGDESARADTEPERGDSCSDHTWSPPSSAYQNEREREFTKSLLTFDGHRLAWKPSGMREGKVGGSEFSMSVGTGDGEAAELVWIYGMLVPSRDSGPQVDTVAVCTASTTTPRTVLGYLPVDLFRPYTGMPDTTDTRPQTEQELRSVAQASGMRFSSYDVEIGCDVNAIFPGAVMNPGLFRGTAWFGLIGMLAVGGWAIYQATSTSLPRAGAIVVGTFGLLLVLTGLLYVPALRLKSRSPKGR